MSVVPIATVTWPRHVTHRLSLTENSWRCVTRPNNSSERDNGKRGINAYYFA